MAIRWAKIILCVCLWASLPQPLHSVQTKQPDDRQTASRQPRKQQKSFLDYTFQKINPSDTNYGQCIDDGRRWLLSETVQKGYFWSNLIALSLLLAFSFVILFQRGLLNRRALIAAQALCQYQSVLARAEAHANEATRRNHEFAEALRLATDPGARKPTHEPTASDADRRAREKRSPSKPGPVPSTVTTAVTKPEHNGAVAVIEARPEGADSRIQVAPAPPGLDLVAQNNALQQQLVLTQDQVKQLRRQLNESERQLQAEKQKNRSLKNE